jgi:hypothetical protein
LSKYTNMMNFLKKVGTLNLDSLNVNKRWCFKIITTSCQSIVCSNANAFTAVHFVFIFVVC